jgi:hypothetical protein
MAEQEKSTSSRRRAATDDAAGDVQPTVDARQRAKADAAEGQRARALDDPDYARREVGQRPDLPVVEIGAAVRDGGEGPGYIGQVPDETGNDAYTLRGVGESDAAAVADRRAARRQNIG